MTTYQRIINLLTANNVQYRELRHPEVRTSEEAAKFRPGISLSQGAKAIICKCKNRDNTSFFMMVIVPGDKRFDSKKVRKLFDLKDISFAYTDDVTRITDGVPPGGVPPFGNLFDLKTIVDKTLLQHTEIAFNAGDKTISIIMRSKDWVDVVKPDVVDIL